MSGEGILTKSKNISLYDLSVSKCKTGQSYSDKQRINFFRDIDGNSPWHRAVNNPQCSLDDVRKLTKFASIINKQNLLGHTALHCAVIGNCQKIDVINFLIDNGANVNLSDCNGSIPLHKALQNPKCTLQLIDLLINKDADLRVRQYNCETPLMLAVKNHTQNMELIEQIMHRGCIDVCADHKESHTTMQIICSNPSMINAVLQHASSGAFDDEEHIFEDIIEFSCSRGICGFKCIEGRSSCTDLSTALLLHAVRHPSYNMEVIRSLLDKGANVYAYDCHSFCTLDYALCNPECSPRLIWELLKWGQAEKHRKPWVPQKNVLHLAVKNRKCPAEVINILLKKNHTKLNSENRDGMTPLDCAADLSLGTDCNLDVIETLMINGATTKKSWLFRPVMWKNLKFLESQAANREALECMKLLLKYGLIDTQHSTFQTYMDLVALIRPFMKRDKFGSFAELNTYLNACTNEISILQKKKFNHAMYCGGFISYFKSNLGHDNPFLMYHEELFWFLVCNLCPSYNSYILFYFNKRFLVNKLFEVKIHVPKANGTSIFLNAYCTNHLTQFLKNKDLFNLFVAFADQKDIKRRRNVGQKWLYRLDDMDWEEPMESRASIAQPEKRHMEGSVRPEKRCKMLMLSSF